MAVMDEILVQNLGVASAEIKQNFGQMFECSPHLPNMDFGQNRGVYSHQLLAKNYIGKVLLKKSFNYC